MSKEGKKGEEVVGAEPDAAALLFMYGTVLKRPLGLLEGVVRARRPRRLPVVLTREEVAALLYLLEGVPLLVCTLLYGTGLRLLECLRLRVRDLDFARGEILIRDGKGEKDRVTKHDLDRGLGRASLPHALSRKYPGADREWGWQWVFPAGTHYVDRETGVRLPPTRSLHGKTSAECGGGYCLFQPARLLNFCVRRTCLR